MYFAFNRYFSGKIFLIWASEIILLFCTALLVTYFRFGFSWIAVLNYDPQFLKAIIITATNVAAFYYFDLYLPENYYTGRQTYIRLFKAVLVTAIVLHSIYFIFPTLKTWRGILIADILFIPLFVLVWRKILSQWFNISLPSEKVLIIGSGELAKKLGTEIYKKSEMGLKLFGFIDDDPAMIGQSIVNPGVIGGYGDILRIVNSEKIDRIIVALPDRRTKLPMSALLECKMQGVSVEEGTTFNERMTGQIPIDQLKPSWMVFSEGFKSLRSRKMVKRVFDVCFAISYLIIAAPIALLTAILIKLDSEGPVILKQVRVGENGKEFNIYKFRSMRQDAEAATGPQWASKTDDRVTSVGRIIRKLRIDEIPQLINVLKGDMSFVGPRPERPHFVKMLKESIPYYEIRSAVKPGITGWAQIKYEYGATVQDALEKLQYDIYYIKNMSPILDTLIFFWTIKVVLTGKGAR